MAKEQRDIELDNGCTVRISGNIDMFSLTLRDRAFVSALADLANAFDEESTRLMNELKAADPPAASQGDT